MKLYERFVQHQRRHGRACQRPDINCPGHKVPLINVLILLVLSVEALSCFPARPCLHRLYREPREPREPRSVLRPGSELCPLLQEAAHGEHSCGITGRQPASALIPAYPTKGLVDVCKMSDLVEDAALFMYLL